MKLVKKFPPLFLTNSYVNKTGAPKDGTLVSVFLPAVDMIPGGTSGTIETRLPYGKGILAISALSSVSVGHLPMLV